MQNKRMPPNSLSCLQARMRACLIIGFSSLISAGFAFLFFDYELSLFFYENRTHWLVPFFSWITHLGWGAPYYILCLLGMAYGKWGRRDHQKEQGWLIGSKANDSRIFQIFRRVTSSKHRKKIGFVSGQILVALVGSGLLVLSIKAMVGRVRPYRSFAPDIQENPAFVFFSTNPDYLSFPSGHTQVIFTVATMLSLFFPSSRKVLFPLGIIVGFSRVVNLSHYFSDILVGGCIGILAANIIFRLQKKEPPAA